MISDRDRIVLIKYRIQQAHETIELAEFLLTYKKPVVCVNRIYYGMFYALTALALKHQFETSKHSQLIGWFNKKFVAKGLIDKKYGKTLKNAFQNRTKGDYDAYVEFDTPEVEEMVTEMKEFVYAIENIL